MVSQPSTDMDRRGRGSRGRGATGASRSMTRKPSTRANPAASEEFSAASPYLELTNWLPRHCLNNLKGFSCSPMCKLTSWTHYRHLVGPRATSCLTERSTTATWSDRRDYSAIFDYSHATTVAGNHSGCGSCYSDCLAEWCSRTGYGTHTCCLGDCTSRWPRSDQRQAYMRNFM